jgi:hypothetical protein
VHLCGICIVARTGYVALGLVLHRVSALLVRLLKQANTNMQRLFDMFVRSTAQLSAGTCCIAGFVQTLLAASQGLWKHTARSAVLQDAFPCNSTTLYCYYHAPGPSVYRHGCLQACVIDASIGFVQHSLLAYTGFVQRRYIHARSLDEHCHNHVQPLNVQSCTAS